MVNNAVVNSAMVVTFSNDVSGYLSRSSVVCGQHRPPQQEKVMKNRFIIVSIAAVGVVGLAVAGCSSSKKDSSSTTTAAPSTTAKATSSTVGNVLPPIIITPEMADANNGGTAKVPPIKVGDTVVFNMGAPAKGATISIGNVTDPKVFQVTSAGTNDGTVATNPGGKAIGVGTTKVDLGASGIAGHTDGNFLGTYTLVVTK